MRVVGVGHCQHFKRWRLGEEHALSCSTWKFYEELWVSAEWGSLGVVSANCQEQGMALGSEFKENRMKKGKGNQNPWQDIQGSLWQFHDWTDGSPAKQEHAS